MNHAITSRHGHKRVLVAISLAAALLIAGFGMPYSLGGSTSANVLTVEHPRVVVLKSTRRLFLYEGDELIRAYSIDLGEEARGDKYSDFDRRTPEGSFRICSKVADSQYHRFLGFDYPGENAVRMGLAENLISPGQAEQIRQSRRAGERPPWDTPLGGGIGLHGHRKGIDWTAGCVALDDRHIDELFAILRIGDEVEILP